MRYNLTFFVHVRLAKKVSQNDFHFRMRNKDDILNHIQARTDG